MAHALFSVERTEQVWFAKHGKRFQAFGSLGGVKEFFEKRYAGTDIAWEEGESSGEEWVQGLNGFRVSTLMCCTSSVRYGIANAVQKWEDTGWRVWREQ